MVDEEDIKHIKPLPNLDYKIMQGNSLLEEFEGIRLFNEKLIESTPFDNGEQIKNLKEKQSQLQKEYFQLHNAGKLTEIKKYQLETELQKSKDLLKHVTELPETRGKQESLVYSMEVNKKAIELRKLHQEFFNAFQKSRKDKLREKIEELERDLIEATLKEQNKESALEKLVQFKKLNIKPFFLWKLNFEDVFYQKGGFDVVIANPPYVSHDKIYNKDAIKKAFSSYEPFADIYCYFLELALKLQNHRGLLCFITSNSYLKAEYGSPIRKYIMDNNYILDLVNIEDAQVFDNAIVNVAVIHSSKSKYYADYSCRIVNSQFTGDISFEEFVQRKSYFYSQKEFIAKAWNLAEPNILALQRKIESKGNTLEELGTKIRLGLATGNNDAFIIDEQTRDKFYRSNRQNAEIIKPILRGRDIFRYYYTSPELYILLTKNGVNVKKDYPDIYRHLGSFGEKFKSRGARGTHWTNLRACSFFDDFKKEKIVWIELTDIGRFALCTDEIYLLNSAYFLLPPSEYPARYLLGILNSKVIKFYLNLIAETSGMGTSRWINNYVKEFPIPVSSTDDRASLISLVNKILANPDSTDVPPLEKEIDRLVYKLYDLTPEEIAIVEGEK